MPPPPPPPPLPTADLTALDPAARASLQLGTAEGLKVVNTGSGIIQVEWDALKDSKATIPVADDTW